MSWVDQGAKATSACVECLPKSCDTLLIGTERVVGGDLDAVED